MKMFAAVIFTLFLICPVFPLCADGAKTAYTAEVKGIVCQACAADVKAAFAKLPGVGEIEIKKAESSDVCLIKFSSSSDKLTIEDCERALGDKMKEFPVVKMTAKK